MNWPSFLSKIVGVVTPAAVGAGGRPTTTVFPTHVQTFEAEPVVYSEEESDKIARGPPPSVRKFMDRWIAGASSAVRQFKFVPYGNDANYGSMFIRFTTGTKSYNYPNVPWTELVAIIGAPSRGKYVNNHLRPLYSVGRGRFGRKGRP